ncbi:DNA topoisomerase 2 [Tanacetum coccineum]
MIMVAFVSRYDTWDLYQCPRESSSTAINTFKIKDFFWVDNEDDDAIELAFSKTKIEERKDWLRAFKDLFIYVSNRCYPTDVSIP